MANGVDTSAPRKKARSLAQELPPEILSHIFGIIALEFRPQVSFSLHCAPKFTSLFPAPQKLVSTFNALSKVCFAWRGPAMRELLKDLCLEQDGQIIKIVNGLTRTSAKGWLTLTTHLRVGWNRQPAIPVNDPDLLLLPELISSLPNLRYVTLGGEQYDLCTSKLEIALSSCQHLIGLDCENILLPYHDSIRFGPLGRRSGETISRLLVSCPNLQQVRFDDFRSLYHGILTLPHGYASTTCLRSVALRRVVLESDGLVKLLQPLKNTLKELYMSRSSLGPTENFRAIMISLGNAGLERLEITECEVWAEWRSNEQSLIDTLLVLPHIQTLSILGPLDATSPTFQKISPCLKKLTVGSSGVRLQEMLGAFKRGWVIEQLHIQIGGLRCKWSPEHEKELENVCKDLDIDLVCKRV